MLIVTAVYWVEDNFMRREADMPKRCQTKNSM